MYTENYSNPWSPSGPGGGREGAVFLAGALGWATLEGFGFVTGAGCFSFDFCFSAGAAGS